MTVDLTAEPTNLDLYVPFDEVASILGADTPDRRQAIGELLADMDGDEVTASDGANIIEREGKRFIRWHLLWCAAEYIPAGDNVVADRLFDSRADLHDAAKPLSAFEEAAPAPRQARSRRAPAAADAAPTAAPSENAARLRVAMAGLPAADEAPVTAPPSVDPEAAPAPKRTRSAPRKNTAAAAAVEETAAPAVEPPTHTQTELAAIGKALSTGGDVRKYVELMLARAELEVTVLREVLGKLAD